MGAGTMELTSLFILKISKWVPQESDARHSVLRENENEFKLTSPSQACYKRKRQGMFKKSTTTTIAQTPISYRFNAVPTAIVETNQFVHQAALFPYSPVSFFFSYARSVERAYVCFVQHLNSFIPYEKKIAKICNKKQNVIVLRHRVTIVLEL